MYVFTYEELLSSKLIFMISQKILLMREKDCSVWTLGGSVGVFCLRSETDLMVAPIGAEDLTRPHALINEHNIHIDSI